MKRFYEVWIPRGNDHGCLKCFETMPRAMSFLRKTLRPGEHAEIDAFLSGPVARQTVSYLDVNRRKSDEHTEEAIERMISAAER